MWSCGDRPGGVERGKKPGGRDDINMISLWPDGQRSEGMSDMLIRGLDKKTVARLKARAKRNGRSTQSEARKILESAAGSGMEEFRKFAESIRERLKGRYFGDAVEMIREDRDR